MLHRYSIFSVITFFLFIIAGILWAYREDITRRNEPSKPEGGDPLHNPRKKGK